MEVVADIRVTVSTPMSTGVKDVEQVQAATKAATISFLEKAVVDTPLEEEEEEEEEGHPQAEEEEEHPPALVAMAYWPVTAIGTNVLVVSFV